MKPVYILGPEGTFSSMTISQLNRFKPIKVIYVKTIPEIFHHTSHNSEAYGVVPSENMSTGNIGITLELLQRYEVNILAELFMDICFAMIYKGEPEKIERLYVFGESYDQCSTFIFEDLPGFDRIDTNSNIDSFHRYQADKNPETAAAIIPLPYFHINKLGETYRAKENIQNNSDNFTRFILIKKSNGHPLDFAKNKTSIFVDTFEDRPSLLFDILQAFREFNINLDSLHSKPSKKYRRSYGFFIDFINRNPEVTQSCLNKLKELNIEFRVLGAYDKINK